MSPDRPTIASGSQGLRDMRIQDFVDMPTLQRIQDTFAKAMSVAAVTVDRFGKPVTTESNFQPICRLIRSTPGGLARCHGCDARGGMTAYQSGKPATYICQGGLVDAAAPIIIDGLYLGSLVCGQVVHEDERDSSIQEIVQRNVTLGLPREQLVKAVRCTPSIARERLDAAMEMLSLTANHIIEIGMSNLVQARLLQEAEEKAAVEKALRDAQLRALQARINPHFLFNSLTLVSYTAFEEEAPKTEKVAYLLSDLLRYSLRNTSTTVPLSEEFDMVDRCLSLHQMRFGEQLNKVIELDPNLKHLPVPCMILQPLVENAIVHGVESLMRPVTIRVSAWRKGDRVQIEVYDDGIGMSLEQVAELNEHRRVLNDPSRRRPSLGLQSVITRLDNEYGDDFRLRVESSPDRGTRILLAWTICKESCEDGQGGQSEEVARKQ